MLYAGGSACLALKRRVLLLGCLGSHLGLLRPRAETPNRAISERTSVLWSAMSEARLHVPIVAPFGVALGLGAGVPILRPETTYARADGTGTAMLHRPSPWVLTGDIGVGVFFP
jgi:hypothetical protein